MKYIRQFAIILGVSFLGEIFNYILPFPVPASIYGLLIMFILLITGVVKKESVKDISSFLLGIMPMMFIPAAGGIIEKWPIIKPIIIPAVVVCVPVTVIVMVITGHVTQAIIRIKEGKHDA